MASRPASFSAGSSTKLGQAVDHGAPVVDRVVEDRAGQHQAVHQGHGHTDRRRPLGRPQAPAGHRAVHVEVVAQACVRGRHDHRPAVDVHAQVADEPGVEHGVEILAAVGALLGQASQAHPVGRPPVVVPACPVGLAHGTIVARRPRGLAPRRSPARARRCRTAARAAATIRSTRPNEGEHRSPRSVTP